MSVLVPIWHILHYLHLPCRTLSGIRADTAKVETTNQEKELTIVLPVPGNISLPGLVCKPSCYQSAVCIWLDTWQPPGLAHDPMYTAGGLLNLMTEKMAGVP